MIDKSPLDESEESRFIRLRNAKLVMRVRTELLGLTRQKATIMFGGGHSGIANYENGITPVPKSLVILFRLLEKHPHLVEEVLNMRHE